MSSDSSRERKQARLSSVSLAPPLVKEPLPCPRCRSTTTKFCYYNNYNLCQPRYFCKVCRRYWTHGGALRNVPIGGGGSRKCSSTSSKRLRSSPSSANSTCNSSESVIKQEPKHENELNLKESHIPSAHCGGHFSTLLSMQGSPPRVWPLCYNSFDGEINCATWQMDNVVEGDCYNWPGLCPYVHGARED